MSLAKHISTKKTSQLEQIPGKRGERQVKNSEGGYVFQPSDMDKLDRFLIIGSEGGSFYASEKNLTISNAKTIIKLIGSNGVNVVKRVVEISTEGRAHKNVYALLVLAMASSPNFADETTRKLAYEVLPKVARIGTHLFQFLEYRKEFAGWGDGMKKAVASWYNSKDADKLAYQVAKYQQRNGWAHRDVLRLAHPKAATEMHGNIFDWAVRGYNTEKTYPKVLEGMHLASVCEGRPQDHVKLIQDYGLTREMLPTEWLKEQEVWESMLETMPMTAMIRNLGNMSKVGLLKPLSEASKKVVAKLGDVEVLQKARVHPVTILGALNTYAQGHGMRGSGKWEVVQQVADALDRAFYASFKFVEPTGKNYLLGVDVSASMLGMWGENTALGIDCGTAASAMALVTANVEENYYIRGFSDQFVDLGISPSMRLDKVVEHIYERSFSQTDCALPMIYATKHNMDVDTFVVYTDNETYAGNIQPVQALDRYRQKSGRNAKLIVVGMVSNGFTIADPNDSGMLDCVGFSSDTPNVISEFSR